MGSGLALCFSSWAPGMPAHGAPAPETLAPPGPPTQAHAGVPRPPQQRQPDSTLGPPACLLRYQEGPWRTEHSHAHNRAQPRWTNASTFALVTVPRGILQGPSGSHGTEPRGGSGWCPRLPAPCLILGSPLQGTICPAALLRLCPGESGLKARPSTQLPSPTALRSHGRPPTITWECNWPQSLAKAQGSHRGCQPLSHQVLPAPVPPELLIEVKKITLCHCQK